MGGGALPTKEEAFAPSSADLRRRSGGQDQEDMRRAKNHTMAFIQEHGSSSSSEEEARADRTEESLEGAGSPQEERDRIRALSKEDYDYSYSVLKLRPRAATEDDVTRSYRSLALAVHPDKSIAAGLAKDEAEALFKIVAAAKDEVLRRLRRARRAPAGTRAEPSASNGSGKRRRDDGSPASGGAPPGEPDGFFGKRRRGSGQPPSGGAGQDEPGDSGRGQQGSDTRQHDAHGLRAGDAVELTRLDKRPDLNGKHGTLTSWNGERWSVELRSGEQVAVKRDNLLPASEAATPTQMEEAQLFLQSLQGEYVAQEDHRGPAVASVVVDGEGKCTFTPTDGDTPQYTEQLIVADDGEITMSKTGWKTHWRYSAARERLTPYLPRRLSWRRRGDPRLPEWVGVKQDQRAKQEKRGVKQDKWAKKDHRAVGRRPPRAPEPSWWRPGDRVEVVGHRQLNMKRGKLVLRSGRGWWYIALDESVGGRSDWKVPESRLRRV